MGQHQIHVTARAIGELRVLLEVNRNQAVENFVKPFRAFCAQHDWAWFGLEPKRLLDFNAMQLFTAYCHGRYCDERLQHLRAQQDWIFRADPDCADKHQQLDRLVLPSDHEFWNYYTPPLGWRCNCYLIGMDRPSMMAILGGDPVKRPPEWWNTIDPVTGLRPGIEEPWSAQDAPELLLLLAAIVDGHAPGPQ